MVSYFIILLCVSVSNWTAQNETELWEKQFCKWFWICWVNEWHLHAFEMNGKNGDNAQHFASV